MLFIVVMHIQYVLFLLIMLASSLSQKTKYMHIISSTHTLQLYDSQQVNWMQIYDKAVVEHVHGGLMTLRGVFQPRYEIIVTFFKSAMDTLV